jgi:hypothetical protein
MRFPFRKDPSEAVRTLMITHVIEFLETSNLEGVGQQKLLYPELYLLAHWLQLFCLTAEAEGDTPMFRKIIEWYVSQSLPRTLWMLMEKGRITQQVGLKFQSHVHEHVAERMREYDAAVMASGTMQGVASIAVPYLITEGITQEQLTLAVAGLNKRLTTFALSCGERLRAKL